MKILVEFDDDNGCHCKCSVVASHRAEAVWRLASFILPSQPTRVLFDAWCYEHVDLSKQFGMLLVAWRRNLETMDIEQDNLDALARFVAACRLLEVDEGVCDYAESWVATERAKLSVSNNSKDEAPVEGVTVPSFGRGL